MDLSDGGFLIASAPGRCGIVGNPSDMYGGHVVSASIPVRNRVQFVDKKISQNDEDTRLIDAVKSRYPALDLPGLIYHSDVPRSSGLSGSTAMLASILACALQCLNALPDLNTINGKTEFAETLRDIERHEANVVCGFQDAYMITFGGVQSMDFAGKHPTKKGQPAQLTSLDCELPFLLITTGVERLSGSVHGPLSQRWLENDPLVRKNMKACAEIGREGHHVLVTQDWHQLAKLMNLNQTLIQEMGGSGEAIDRLVDDCLSCGALAGKLAGAGMGGTVIALTLNKLELEERLRQRGYNRFLSPEKVDGVRLEDS